MAGGALYQRNPSPAPTMADKMDVNPGDRAAECGGDMEPVRVFPDARRGYVILHRCTRCGAERRCRAAHEAKVQPDDLALLIRLTAGKF